MKAKTLLVSLLLFTSTAFAQGQPQQTSLRILEYIPEHPAMGTYDVDPDYYKKNSHHSKTFIALFQSEFNGLNFANYINEHDPHFGHDHTWDIDGYELSIRCWDYSDYKGTVRGKISEDWNTIEMEDGETYHRVSGKRFGPGRVEW